MADDRMELLPLGRFEWEHVARRVPLTPSQAKGTGFILASFANPDGSRIRPGVKLLAELVGVNVATVVRHMACLSDAGLIQRTKQGNRHSGSANEYRLTRPVDLYSRVRLLGVEGADMDGEVIHNLDVYIAPAHSRVEGPAPHEEMSGVHQRGVWNAFGPSLERTGAQPPDHNHQPQPQQLGSATQTPHVSDVDNSRIETAISPSDYEPANRAYADWKRSQLRRSS